MVIQPVNSNPADEAKLPDGVKNIIAVASGKGGVGKSTVSLNLALALAQQGAKVGVLDADIYGPSIGMMLGEKGAIGLAVDKDKIVPVEKWGLKVVSFGFILEDDKPVIWRGPLLNKAIDQFLFDVKWGEIDYLIIDMPPGTGDVQLSLAQKTKLTAGLIVTTPQNIALLDAQKAAQMFNQLNIPILGIVENMSYYVCPNCNHKSHIFSTAGGEKLADKMKSEVIGHLPLLEDILNAGDQGTPAAMLEKNSVARDAFAEIAKNVVHKVSLLRGK